MTQISKRRLGRLLPVEMFKALGDPTRVTMLAALASDGPTTVSDLASCCPVDMSVVSRHLKVLKQAGILESERRGKNVEYRVRVDHLVDVLRSLADALESCCGGDER
jgi:DNA-binding transcriptional ArsR family regulator